MKAPDKIYLQIDKPTGAMFVNYDRNDKNNIEYIRKDALIEWAESMKRICKGSQYFEQAYQTVINKLESI